MKRKVHRGVLLKKYRQLKGFSQIQLAEAIGKTQAMVSILETSGYINDETLELIANSLEISVELLRNENPEIAEDNFLKNLTKDKFYSHLIEEIIFLKDIIEKQNKIIENLSLKNK